MEMLYKTHSFPKRHSLMTAYVSSPQAIFLHQECTQSKDFSRESLYTWDHVSVFLSWEWNPDCFESKEEIH